MNVLEDGTTGTLRSETHGHEPVIIQAIPIHDQATRHAGKHGDKQDGKGNGLGIGQPGDPMNTLTKGDRHAVAQPIPFRETADCLTSAYGTKWNGNASADNGSLFVQQPIPLDLRNASRDPEKHDEVNRQGVGVGEAGDPAHTLTTACVHGVAQQVTAAFKGGQGSGAGGIGYSEHVAPTLPASDGGNRTPTLLQHMAVRRLTPVECERLQGFPDNYTNIPWRKKEDSPDGPRYKALGNSMAVPVMYWIGKRIADAP